MGTKGDKLSKASVLNTELILDKLSAINGVSAKKMFGGHGIFHEAKMFGLIDSKGKAFLKANEETRNKYLDRGGEQHSRMPYYSIPDDVFNDAITFESWVKESIALSK